MGHVTIEEFNPLHGYWNFRERVDSNDYVEGTLPASKYEGGHFRVTHFDDNGKVVDAAAPVITPDSDEEPKKRFFDFRGSSNDDEVEVEVEEVE